MIIQIKIPYKEFEKEQQEELFTMFKLLCDNIDTNGLTCERL